MLKIMYLFPLVLFSVSCATTNDVDDNNKNIEPGALDIILCKEPRPYVCTREYNPVCGKLQDGSSKTGSTACSSCSDAKVVGYTIGEC